MYKAELELEKRLNDIALANVPSTSYENIVVVPRMRHHTPLDMKPDDFDLRDLMLDQKMNVISMNAIVDKLGWKPSKIKTDVTKEMIADYQLEQMKNLKNGLYVPASLDLDLLDLPPPVRRLDERERNGRRRALEAISAEMDDVQSLISGINPAIPSIDAIKNERQNDLDRAFGAEIARIDDPATGMNALQRKRARLNARKEYDKRIAEIERLRNRDEYNFRQRLAGLEANFLDIQRVLTDNDREISEYQQQVSEVQAENARRRRIYEDAVKSVNIGRNFVAMLPDETADEYKERLKQIGDSTANTDAVQAAAGLLYSDRLREKMSEITRDEVLVNTFIKALTSEQRYSLVKIWETFKKKVVEIFGVDNKNLTPDDLNNIAEELTDIVAARAIAEPVFFKEVDKRDEAPLRAFAVAEGGLPPLVGERASPTSSPTSLLAPALAPPPVFQHPEFQIIGKSGFHPPRKIELMRLSVEGGEPKKWPGDDRKIEEKKGDEMVKLYRAEAKRALEHYEAREKERRRFERRLVPAESGGAEEVLPPIKFASRLAEARARSPRSGIPSLNALQQELLSKLGDLDEEESARFDGYFGIESPEEFVRQLNLAGIRFAFQTESMTGFGVKYPKIVPFGLIELSPHKLFYENILKITRKGKHLTGFPNVKVSNEFVTFLFKILDGGQPTLKDVNKLSVGEKQLFDSVVFTAGLQKKVESTGSGVKQKLKDRMALIEGEIEAGNTSDELIKEARQILQHLARMKVIGHRAASGHLKQLINVQRG